jgi:DNA-binding transcriptional MerR regulator
MANTISVLADSVGLSTDTVRYYERLGLLPPPERSDAGYRLYDEEAGERLQFIKSAQRMGLRLGDIKELLDVRDRGKCPCGHTQTLVQRRLDEVDAEIKQLTSMRKQLLNLKTRNEECLDDPLDEWLCNVGFQRGGASDEDLS